MISDLQQCSLITRTVSSSFHSLVVSPKVEPSTPSPSTHPPLEFPPLVSPMHHTNPFSPSQSTPPPISPCNPFFSLLRLNPFYDDMLTAPPLKPSLPPLPYLSSSRPLISDLLAQTNDANADSGAACRSVCSDTRTDRAERAGNRPLAVFSRRSSNPFTEMDSQWDDSFEAFAAGRLQPPEDLTAERRARRHTSDRPSNRCSDVGGVLLPLSCDTPACGPEARSPASRSAGAVAPMDAFPFFLETIPEHNDGVASDTPLDLPLNNSAHADNNQANGNTNAGFLTDTNADSGSHRPSAAKLSSGSPDPPSSGIGSSVEEDFLSCLSSFSDKFSASSAEESEAHTSEADVTGFEQSRESSEVLEESLALRCSPVGKQHQPAAAAAALQPKSKETEKTGEFRIPEGDFPPAEVRISSPPDVLEPEFDVAASSPDVEQSWAALPPEGASADSPGSSFDSLLTPASVPHSLYLSSDSQNYQTCDSRSPSRYSGGSEPTPGPRSANSTLRGDLLTDAAFPDTPTHSRECSAGVLQPAFSLEGGCGLDRRLAHRAPHAVSDEGSLKPSPDEHLGASSAGSSPLASPAPLTPDHTSSPVALCPLPPFANATARPPASTPQAAAAKPVSPERQQQQQQRNR